MRVIERLPSTSMLNHGERRRWLKLPVPCISLVGCEVIRRFGFKTPDGQLIIPSNPLQERWDPRLVLLHWPYDIRPFVVTRIAIPDHVVAVHNMGATAREVLDRVASAVLDVATAVREYTSRVSNINHPRARTQASRLAAALQRAVLNLDWVYVQELKRLLRRHIHQSPFTGVNAPLVPDPTLGLDSVRVPADVWPAFHGRLAIVLRHPVLEHVYRLTPVMGKDRVIGLNPLLFDKLGADVDGDSLFVTPCPRSLDAGQLVFGGSPDYSESNVLLKDLPQDERQWLPVQLPELDLAHMGAQSEFVQFAHAKGIRNYKNAIWEPLDAQRYWHESLAAAGRFWWEKQAIGKADSMRRKLNVMTDDPQIVRAVNRYCSVITQKAIDAGKHRVEFPLADYQLAMQGHYVVSDGYQSRKQAFASAEQMAYALVQIVDDMSLMDDAQAIAEFLFSFDLFPNQAGLFELVEMHCPWLSMASNKQQRQPGGGEMLPEVRCLLNLQTAVCGPSNLWL